MYRADRPSSPLIRMGGKETLPTSFRAHFSLIIVASQSSTKFARCRDVNSGQRNNRSAILVMEGGIEIARVNKVSIPRRRISDRKNR